MTMVVDKEAIRKSLREMAIQEPEFVNSLMVEVADLLKETKRQRLERIVAEDFAEYEDVFRRLA